MTVGQILFELRATQKRTEGQTDGRMGKGKSKCPSLKWGHKNENFNNLTFKVKVIHE
jgi:hypothetical protein